MKLGILFIIVLVIIAVACIAKKDRGVENLTRPRVNLQNRPGGYCKRCFSDFDCCPYKGLPNCTCVNGCCT